MEVWHGSGIDSRMPKVNDIGTQILCNTDSRQEMPITGKCRSVVADFIFTWDASLHHCS